MTDTNPATVVGANVRAELARAGKTQIWLADVLQMKQQSVSDRLRGVVAFDVNELTQVASALGVPVAVLLGSPVTT